MEPTGRARSDCGFCPVDTTAGMVRIDRLLARRWAAARFRYIRGAPERFTTPMQVTRRRIAPPISAIVPPHRCHRRTTRSWYRPEHTRQRRQSSASIIGLPVHATEPDREFRLTDVPMGNVTSKCRGSFAEPPISRLGTHRRQCPRPTGSRSRHPAWPDDPKAKASSRYHRSCGSAVRQNACFAVHWRESRSTAPERASMNRRITDFNRAGIWRRCGRGARKPKTVLRSHKSGSIRCR